MLASQRTTNALKAVQRLAHVGLPGRGSPGKGNSFFSNLKNLKSNGHAANGTNDEVDDVQKEVTSENGPTKDVSAGKVTEEDVGYDVEKTGARIGKITIKSSVVSG